MNKEPMHKDYALEIIISAFIVIFLFVLSFGNCSLKTTEILGAILSIAIAFLAILIANKARV